MDWNLRTNGTFRGILIVLLIAAVITAAGVAGDIGLYAVLLALQIAFVIVLAIVLFRLWRTHRGEIAMWGLRSRIVFYGSAAVALVDLVGSWVVPGYPSNGLEALIFFGVLVGCGFAMYRVWNDEHTYGY